MKTVPIKKLPACSPNIRIYLSDYGAVRIETDQYRCEMRPEDFLTLLRQKQHNNKPEPKGDFYAKRND